MNNGQPPYGDPSQWGQQPTNGQAPFAPGQYPQQSGSYTPPSGPYQLPYDQTGYGQPFGQSQPWQPQTYQPQNHQAPQSYQQQSWQPYGQESQPSYAAFPAQQSYVEPQQPYPQMGYQQGGYQQNGYQQGGYQQGGYQQLQESQTYLQSMQNAQPLQTIQPRQPANQYHQAQGFSGYVSGGGGGEEKQPLPITPELITKIALFGVLPLLFLLGVLLPSRVLCWIFLLAAGGAMAAIWLRELVDSNLRLVSTVVCSVLAVVALWVGVAGPGNQQQTGSGSMNATAGQMGAQLGGGSLSLQNVPTATPRPTADPFAEAGAAAERLQSFFYFWHVNNDESMLALTAPSWRNKQAEPLKALFTIRANRTPADDVTILSISGDEADSVRTAKVTVTISRNITGRTPDVLVFDVMMLKEDGAWYVDPASLVSNEVVSTTKALNPMPTQPVLNTAKADTLLYYNPSGGEYYHFDPYCGKIDPRYLPLKGQFYYSQLEEAAYKGLKNCTYCGAPLRGQ